MTTKERLLLVQAIDRELARREIRVPNRQPRRMQRRSLDAAAERALDDHDIERAIGLEERLMRLEGLR